MDATKQPYALAAKAVIFNEKEEVLCIKRRDNDPHAPGAWEIPGGRLEPGESPFEGLAREVREEVSIVVTVHEPLQVDYFTRDDGQKITLIVFHCKMHEGSITLSEEHTEYAWLPLAEAKQRIRVLFGDAMDRWELCAQKS